MNVFILCTGRCGSVSIVEASRHMTNYSADHECRAGSIGDQRLDYPENHIEADNRLSWYLGRLHYKYGSDAFYVHLKRDLEQTAKSYSKRRSVGIMKAFDSGLLRRKNLSEDVNDSLKLARDICGTMDANIRHFLEDKPNKMVMNLETIKADFEIFWEKIGAEGDLQKALQSFDNRHNTSEDFHQQRNSLRRYWRKFKQALGLPPSKGKGPASN